MVSDNRLGKYLSGHEYLETRMCVEGIVHYVLPISRIVFREGVAGGIYMFPRLSTIKSYVVLDG